MLHIGSTHVTGLHVIEDETPADYIQRCRQYPERRLVSHCLNGLCGISREIRATVRPVACPTCGCPVQTVPTDQPLPKNRR